MWSRSHGTGSSMIRVVGSVPVIARTLPRSRAASVGPAADLGGGARGQPEQLLVGGREDRGRVPGGGPDDVVARELDVDERADRLGVADRGDPADGLAGVLGGRTSGAAGRSRRDAEQGGHLRLVDPVRAAGEDQHGASRPTSKTRLFDDRAHRDVERGRGGRGGADLGREHAHLAGRRRPPSAAGRPSATRGCAGEGHGADPATGMRAVRRPDARRRRSRRSVARHGPARLDGDLRGPVYWTVFEHTFEHCRSAAAPRLFPARSGGPGPVRGRGGDGGECVMSRVLGEAAGRVGEEVQVERGALGPVQFWRGRVPVPRGGAARLLGGDPGRGGGAGADVRAAPRPSWSPHQEVWRVEAVRAGRSRTSFAGVYDLSWDAAGNRWWLVRVHD